MEYRDQVPIQRQIAMNEFKLLPGSRVRGRFCDNVCKEDCTNCLYDGIVREVWCANPEYVLLGENAPDAGVILWTESERDECAAFLGGGHMPVKIRLYKSMWVKIEFLPRQDRPEYPLPQIPYTYEVEGLIRSGRLVVVQK